MFAFIIFALLFTALVVVASRTIAKDGFGHNEPPHHAESFPTHQRPLV